MTFKKLFLLITTVLLFSCVSEEPIHIPEPLAEELTFDVNLLLGEAINKRELGSKGNGHADGMEHAMVSELVVTNCAIAVFDFDKTDQPAKLIGFKREDITGTVDPSLTYQVKGISARMQKVRILAVANSALTNELDRFADFDSTPFTYAQFKALAETTDYSVLNFDPETLVKMGEVDHTFAPANIKEPVIVPMEQLAARVDLKIKVGFEKELISRHYEIVLPEGNTESFLNNLDTKRGTNENDKILIGYPDGTFLKAYNCGESDRPLYYNGVKLGSQRQIAHFESALVNYSRTNKQYALYIKSITINNIQTKTDVILPANAKVSNNSYQGGVNGEELCVWKNGRVNKIVTDELVLTFYTYEKALYNSSDLSRAIDVVIDADLVEVISTTTKLCINKNSIHGVFVQNPARFYLCDGEENKIAEVDDSAPILQHHEHTANPSKFTRKYSIVVNPDHNIPGCNTDGLVHGNIYVLSASVNEIPTIPEEVVIDPEYNVLEWTRMNAPDHIYQ